MFHRRRSAIWGGLTLGLAVAQAVPLRADTVLAEISAIVRGDEALDSSTEVRFSRLETFTDEDFIEVGTTLAKGDSLTSLSGEIGVELACGAGTLLRFDGPFEVLVNPPEEADCAVDFRAGSMDAVTNEPTVVGVDAVILGSEGTQYSVEVAIEGDERAPTLMVFDGNVRVRGPDMEGEVETGATWKLRRGAAVWGRIDPAQLDRVAQRSARFDASRMKASAGESRAQLVERFKTLHYRVLEKPSDSSVRGELAKEQLEADLASQAHYHLRRGSITTTEQLARYRIAARVATELQEPVKLGLKSRTIRGPLGRDRGGTGVIQRAPVDPFELLERQEYQAAIDLLTKVEKKSSRTYYGLARAFRGLQGVASDRANYYAGLALERHRADALLSSSEIATCRRIQTSYRRRPG